MTADHFKAGGFSLSSTYGLPLSATFVRPGLDSCALHSTCRWLHLPPVGDYSPLLYRLHIHPASVRLDHPIKLLQATIPRSFVLHGKALVVKSRGQSSKCSVLTVRLGHSPRFAVPSFSPSSAPVMQAFAPVVGFSLPEHQARNRLRMAADFQVFSSDRNS